MTAGGTTLFFYYLYFFMRERFGFSETKNLLLAAGLGYLYSVGSFMAGRFAQRFGYFFCLRFGLATMILSMLAASRMDQAWLMMALAAAANCGMCCCWPPLEALMSEGEAPARLQSLVGLYSVSWAMAGAVAYFCGGAILQHNLSWFFYVPVTMFACVLAILVWFKRAVLNQPPANPGIEQAARLMRERSSSAVAPSVFLQMGWIANPMAYVVLNTVVSTAPSLAERFHFRPMLAGIVCSTWLFARAAAFLALSLWPRWHYRFRFLGTSFVAMIASFGVMLTIPNVWALVLSQVVLGFCLGLMYYSSLFYSMDVGEAKGEHGGFHEAAIGLGSGTGPAIAAGAATLVPGAHSSGALGVCVLLLAGFGMLLWMRFRPQKQG
jgi:MFS family permease